MRTNHASTIDEAVGADAHADGDDGRDGVAPDEAQPDEGGGREEDAGAVKDLPRDADRDPSRVDEPVGEVPDRQCHDSESCVGQGGGDSILCGGKTRRKCPYKPAATM